LAWLASWRSLPAVSSDDLDAVALGVLDDRLVVSVAGDSWLADDAKTGRSEAMTAYRFWIRGMGRHGPTSST
jgi:hypothetical protein